jgi:hypothetical protein
MELGDSLSRAMGQDWVRWAEVLVIPLAGVVFSWLWPVMQGWYRRRRFTALIVRELREVGPYPDTPQPAMKWWEHLGRQFVHAKILGEASANRDFILSLDPTLTYHVTQLWSAAADHNAGNWLHYLERCVRYDRSGDVKRAKAAWQALLNGYGALDPSAHHVVAQD